MIVDDSDSQVIYSGKWHTTNDSRDYEGTAHKTSTHGSSFGFIWNGSDISVVGTVEAVLEDSASATVVIDNEEQADMIPQPAGATLRNQTLFASSSLSNGSHSMNITVNGDMTFILDYVNFTSFGKSSLGQASSITIIPGRKSAFASASSSAPISHTSPVVSSSVEQFSSSPASSFPSFTFTPFSSVATYSSPSQSHQPEATSSTFLSEASEYSVPGPSSVSLAQSTTSTQRSNQDPSIPPSRASDFQHIVLPAVIAPLCVAAAGLFLVFMMCRRRKRARGALSLVDQNHGNETVCERVHMEESGHMSPMLPEPFDVLVPTPSPALVDSSVITLLHSNPHYSPSSPETERRVYTISPAPDYTSMASSTMREYYARLPSPAPAYALSPGDTHDSDQAQSIDAISPDHAPNRDSKSPVRVSLEVPTPRRLNADLALDTQYSDEVNIRQDSEPLPVYRRHATDSP